MPSLQEVVAEYDAAKKALADHLVREIRDRGVTELVLERIRDVAPAPVQPRVTVRTNSKWPAPKRTV